MRAEHVKVSSLNQKKDISMRNTKLYNTILAMIMLALLTFCVSACAGQRIAAEALSGDEMAPEQAIESLPHATEPTHIATPDQSTADNAAQPPSPEQEPVDPPIEAWPVWMYIPALNVDAEVLDTGTDYVFDSMEIAPSASIISWWRESVIPGNKGNAIFGGHNRWRGENGQLLHMDTLEIGDEMELIYADGTSLEFRLESVFVYPLATAPARIIMYTGGETRVTLITCKDPYNPAIGTSDNRIIAIFKPAEGFVIPDPPIAPFPLRRAPIEESAA